MTLEQIMIAYVITQGSNSLAYTKALSQLFTELVLLANGHTNKLSQDEIATIITMDRDIRNSTLTRAEVIKRMMKLFGRKLPGHDYSELRKFIDEYLGYGKLGAFQFLYNTYGHSEALNITNLKLKDRSEIWRYYKSLQGWRE